MHKAHAAPRCKAGSKRTTSPATSGHSRKRKAAMTDANISVNFFMGEAPGSEVYDRTAIGDPD